MTETIRIPIQGMSCASCVKSIETVLADTAGVESVSVNLATSSGSVTYDSELTTPLALAAAINSIGYEARLPDDSIAHDNKHQHGDEEEGKLKLKLFVAIALGVPVAVLGMAHLLPAAVAQAAGLHVSRIDGTPLVYNERSAWLPDFLICRQELADDILEALWGDDRIP